MLIIMCEFVREKCVVQRTAAIPDVDAPSPISAQGIFTSFK